MAAREIFAEALAGDPDRKSYQFVEICISYAACPQSLTTSLTLLLISGDSQKLVRSGFACVSQDGQAQEVKAGVWTPALSAPRLRCARLCLAGELRARSEAAGSGHRVPGAVGPTPANQPLVTELQVREAEAVCRLQQNMKADKQYARP